MNPITHITMDTAHYFDGALIAHGWKNSDPDRVERLYRQLVNITQLPPGYEIAISVATPEMEQAGRATGVNAAWSYAACYRSMLNAQPRDPVPCAPAEGKPIGYIPAWAAAQMSDQGCIHRGWGVNTQIYREPEEGYAAIYLAPPDASAPRASTSDYQDVLAEHRRLVRELDVALNGEAGASKQPSLVDIVRQVQREGIVVAPRITPNTLLDQRTALRQALNACATQKE